jgi:hypothetical protein
MYCAIVSPMAKPIPAEKALPTLYLLMFFIIYSIQRKKNLAFYSHCFLIHSSTSISFIS